MKNKLQCVQLIESTSYRCVKDRNHFGECEDQFGQTGRLVITRSQARKDRNAVYRAKLLAGQLSEQMFGHMKK